MMQHAKSQAGFTLLELIVALAISSLLALIGARVLSSTLDFYNRNASRSISREEIRATERILRHEWAGRGATIRSNGLTLEFDTLHPVAYRLPANLALARVRYACENSQDNGIILTHRVSSLPVSTAEGPQPTPQRPDFEETRTLASRLQVCAFSFLGQARESPRNEPQPRWLRDWDDKKPAPDLMRQALSGLRDDMPPVVYKARTGAGIR